MSGHSKWATTKRQKAAVDAKRSSLFTKLSKNITIAARDGADPKSNFKLRLAIDQARNFSMPKDNIERAVARGAGIGSDAQLETVVYEGFGPAGIAVIVEGITDNKNRTSSQVKHLFTEYGGNIGGSGSVMWMFTLRGVVAVTEKKLTPEQELALIDDGILDTESTPEGLRIITPLERLQKIRDHAEQLGLTIESAAAEYIAKEYIRPADEAQLLKFLEAMDELDDVNNIFTNADI